MVEKQVFRVIGLMSGTSMDGLDVVDVCFQLNDQKKWEFKLNQCSLYAFPDVLFRRLNEAFFLSGEALTKLNVDLGKYYAEQVNRFIEDHAIDRSEIDVIASHGQTIFHQPELGYTLQLGNGPELSMYTNLPSVVDFRTKDVALGGNGAPLIPVADFLLFSDLADSFLNLGGFSNLSYRSKDKVLSYDICPVNIVVNKLVEEIGMSFDKNGELGAKGTVNVELFQALNNLGFYQEEGPKSLGREWVEKHLSPLFETEEALSNKVRTLYEHIAFQIGKALDDIEVSSVLLTGGGARNSFLVSRIKALTNKEIVIQSMELVDFKEAIGFAFLGLLRWRGEINVWATVTGASRDTSSGVIYTP